MRFMRIWLTAACLACTFALGAADISAAAQKKPKNATAQCVDGTYSMAKSQQGACSSHGGIKTWYGSAPKAEGTAGRAERKVERTEAKADRKVARTEEKAERKIDRTEDKISPRRVGSPATATGRCNDGTYTYAEHHQGACSNHGGVAEWYR